MEDLLPRVIGLDKSYSYYSPCDVLLLDRQRNLPRRIPCALVPDSVHGPQQQSIINCFKHMHGVVAAAFAFVNARDTQQGPPTDLSMPKFNSAISVSCVC